MTFSNTFHSEQADVVSFGSCLGKGRNLVLVAAGILNVLRAHCSDVARFFANGSLLSDIALPVLSETDARSQFSLGLGNDCFFDATRHGEECGVAELRGNTLMAMTAIVQPHFSESLERAAPINYRTGLRCIQSMELKLENCVKPACRGCRSIDGINLTQAVVRDGSNGIDKAGYNMIEGRACRARPWLRPGRVSYLRTSAI